jgi:phage-related protein
VNTVFAHDPDVTYQIVNADVIETSRPLAFSDKRVYKIKVSAAPYKYLTTGLEQVSFGSSGYVNNPYNYSALPLITITGTGNINLSIGGRVTKLVGVQGNITLDSQTMNAYRIDGTTIVNQNSLMSRQDFPYIKSGNQVISLTSGTGVIIPRFRKL